METLFLLTDSFTNGYNDLYLQLASLTAILTGISVIVIKNPILSVLFLIGLFMSISCYLLLLGLNFIGLAYLLVYIGAVSILFLFILMLINVRISELQAETSNGLPLALLIGICFYSIVYEISPFKIADNINNDIPLIVWELYKQTDSIAYVTSFLWDGYLAETSHITSIGNIMYTSYFLWLMITSLILLLAMVGAIVINIRPAVSK
jgi:NADH-ubiquinone oxidoreductase chain 6